MLFRLLIDADAAAHVRARAAQHAPRASGACVAAVSAGQPVAA